MTEPDGMEDILREFMIESYESLDRLDGELLALESGTHSPDTLGAIFRAVHTIKGTCGFLGLPGLETIAHKGENVLSLLRDGKCAVDPQISDVLLRTVDAIRARLAHLEASGSEGEHDESDLVAQLESIVESVKSGRPVPAEAKDTKPAAEPVDEAPADAPEPPAKEAPSAPAPESPVETSGTPAPVTMPTTDSETASPSAAGPSDAQTRSVTDSAIRVDVGLLDHVMNLVGELVLARNQILQFAPRIKDAGFVNSSARLNLLTTELQEGVMKTRMQPIGNAWNKLPRLVRDLSHSSGKEVTLELEGSETELDRTIIEAIKDPLTHAVRNAVDHGIESVEKRTAAGKPAAGKLIVRAYHEGGQVNIEIRDDGAGLNIDRIRSRAIERGLLSQERAAHLSDREAGQLIFNPGFSTAQKVTNVSGRGVGMDVVKTNIERIGGSVDMSSQAGAGTTLRIKIPLTLAIIPALIVISRGERFAIPQVNLLELVRLEGERVRTGIERLHGTALYRLRGNLLPLVFLHECLQLAEDTTDECDAVNIVVLQAGDRQFGLVVDAISDTEEIVVKPLGKELKGIKVFAGATIMGDGRVALIPDVLGIAQRADLMANGHGPGTMEGAELAESGSERARAVLLFDTGKARMAIPLSIVARLEEVQPARVERTASGPVVQYRGGILPLVDLTGALDSHPPAVDGALNVIVIEQEHVSMGVVVERILDAVEERMSVRHCAGGDGITGSAVIQGCVTDLLDVQSLLESVAPTIAAANAA